MGGPANIFEGLIVHTNDECIFTSRSWRDIPVLVWPEGIDVDVSDWLRATVRDGAATTTAHEYANILRDFVRFCRLKGRAWQATDDDFLRLWRETLRVERQVSKRRANTVMIVIFGFFSWAERTRRLEWRVGIYFRDELPIEMIDYQFPISAVQNPKGKGRLSQGWKSGLTIRGGRRPKGVRHTPTEPEIKDLHRLAAATENFERNSLILSWPEETGLRVSELQSVCKRDIPSREKLADLRNIDAPFVLNLRRKGGEQWAVHVPLDLLERTLEYCEFERRVIVGNFLYSTPGYVEPDELFLSSTTGKVLHADSISALTKLLFLRAGLAQASIHRLRARFAVRIIEVLVDAVFEDRHRGSDSVWIETILTKASQMMGHMSPKSLRFYLNYVLNRKIQTSPQHRRHDIQVEIREKERYSEILSAKIERKLGVVQLAQFIESQNFDEARIELERLIERSKGSA